MSGPQVHAIFGYTLMLAGLARIIEVCFIAPKFLPLGTIEGVEDDQSEHTLAESTTQTSSREEGEIKGRAFRHLPPFVSLILFSCNDMVCVEPMYWVSFSVACLCGAAVYVGHGRGAAVCT